MRILIVGATAAEVAFAPGRHDVDVLVTGVGMVATAVRTTRALLESRYEFALNLGLCGSFDRALPPGTVVHVTVDALPELGAEDGDAFLGVEKLGLIGPDDAPFTDGCLVNAAPPANAALEKLPSVRGITVNTVHGDERTIAAVVSRIDPQVETMEGAAFMYACLVHGVSFAQVRAVSNVVERRNRGAWKIPEALAALAGAAGNILDHV